MRISLEGKTALVTGGSRGIGRAVAVALARAGANVAVNYAGNETAANETKAEIEKLGRECLLVKADVSSEDAVEQMTAAVNDKFGKTDILVNNAGITRDGILPRMKTEDFDAVINTNLKGVFLCTRAVAKSMMKNRAGRIINMASVVGITGNAGQANYSAAKAGVIGFTKTAAKELAARGITVNAIAPGFIETDMTAVLSDDIKSDIAKNIPLKKMGSAEDVANLAVFLASEEASYITGQVVNVDGGLAM